MLSISSVILRGRNRGFSSFNNCYFFSISHFDTLSSLYENRMHVKGRKQQDVSVSVADGIC